MHVRFEIRYYLVIENLSHETISIQLYRLYIYTLKYKYIYLYSEGYEQDECRWKHVEGPYCLAFIQIFFSHSTSAKISLCPCQIRTNGLKHVYAFQLPNMLHDFRNVFPSITLTRHTDNSFGTVSNAVVYIRIQEAS